MAKKFIGIEIGAKTLRVVTMTQEKGTPVFIGAREQAAETAEERSRILAEMLEEVTFGDRVAACLNTVGSYFRLLEFPFGEPKKIETALDLEMSSQLPTNDELVCDFLAPRPGDNDFEVPAAAVKRTSVTDILHVVQRAGQPLHLLDLNPFAYAAGLAEAAPEGVLAVVMQNEVTVAQVKAGEVISFRAMPRRPQDNAEQLAAMIHRDYLAFAGSLDENQLRLFLIGEGAGEELVQALKGMGLESAYPFLEMEGRRITPEMLPAAALALRAALPSRIRRFNFLKGDLAPKNEWSGFRLRIMAIAGLIGLTVILAATGAYLNYVQQDKQAEMLRKETISIFRQTFPQIQTIVDVPSQMRSKIDELRTRARLLGSGQSRSALNVLREISARLPAEVKFDVRELVFSDDQLHIDGTTSSFDAINKLSQALDTSPLFGQSQIADAKMGLDGGRVDFRLNLKIAPEELAQ
jgi:general secretion pathway protein L